MRRLARTLRSLGLAQIGSAYVLPAILINLGNGTAYLFQVLLGRSMEVAEFGAFNALFSAILIVTAPASVLPLIVAQSAMAAETQGEERRLLNYFLLAGFVLSLLLTVIGTAANSVWSMGLPIAGMNFLAAYVTILFSCMHPITVGFLQARGHYIPAALVVGGNPLLRFLLGIALVYALAGGIGGALWAVAVPVAVTFGLGLYFLRELLEVQAGALSTTVKTILRHGAWRQAVSITLLTIVGNIDVVMAHLVLNEHEAGTYAGAAVISRIGLLLPSALATIIFTESARNAGKTGGIPVGILITGAMAAGVAAVFMVAGPPMTFWMLGRDFLDSGSILQILGPAMAMLAMTQACAMHLAGRSNFIYLLPLTLSTATAILLPLYAHFQAHDLAVMTLSINSTILVTIIAMMVIEMRKSGIVLTGRG